MILVNVQDIITDLLGNADVIASLGGVVASLLFSRVFTFVRAR